MSPSLPAVEIVHKMYVSNVFGQFFLSGQHCPLISYQSERDLKKIRNKGTVCTYEEWM